jgi:hypothetical protein
LGCQGESEEIISVLTGTVSREDKVETTNSVWKFIFEKFWPIGKESITFAHRPLAIFYGKNDRDITPEAVAAAIDELRREGYLVAANKKSWVGINITRLGDIASVLGKAA